MTPFSQRNTVLRMLFSAMVGSYGLTFITISALIVAAYVLRELRLI
jgi:hypothetical protein